MTKPTFDNEAIKKDILSGVGYARPPQHSRFQKGKSGNPLGRPRKTKTVSLESQPNSGLSTNAETMRKVRSEPVKVRVNGRIRSMSKAEAVQRSFEKQALGGGVLAMRDLKNELTAEDARRAAELELNHLVWKDYIQLYRTELSHSKETGIPMRGFWIEPENIIIKPGTPVQIRGPYLEEQIKDFEFLQRIVQALLAKLFYDFFIFPKENSARPEVTACIIGIWKMANRMLTAQMERDNEAYWCKLEAMVFPISAIVAELKARWAAIGLPAPIEKPIPPLPPICSKAFCCCQI